MSTNYELVNAMDEQLLIDLLNDERHQILKSYEINIKMFYKFGKKDKDGNLKTPAITKNGIAIPSQIKIVSNFNRITDDVDVKIILNKELWDELTKEEKISTIDNMLNYIQIVQDSEGEPICISESSDKVKIKLKHPDFYCEGFLDMLNIHKQNYLPYKDAKTIAEKI